MHFSEGGYDRIAIKLFQQINVDTYYLEYDTPRAGTFEPLKFLPKHKSVVLGLVSSKIPQVISTYSLLEGDELIGTTVAGGQGRAQA